MIELFCTSCGKYPEELSEYVQMAMTEGCTPDEYVWGNEGTLNRSNGHFLCDSCYIEAGMPSSPDGWVAP